MNRKCVCCGSGNLITGVKLIDKWQNGEDSARVSIDAVPDALVFKGRERANVHSEVCDDCGHLQLFVFKRAGLRAAHEERKKNSPSEKSLRGYINCSNCNMSHRQEDCPKCGFQA